MRPVSFRNTRGEVLHDVVNRKAEAGNRSRSVRFAGLGDRLAKVLGRQVQRPRSARRAKKDVARRYAPERTHARLGEIRRAEKRPVVTTLNGADGWHRFSIHQ